MNAGISPQEIRSIEDITKLPITYKQDLRDNYPFGLFTVPKNELQRIHCSSGTTGKPTVVGYTKEDVDLFSEVVARSLNAREQNRECSCIMLMVMEFSRADWDCIMEQKNWE
jgi:phenylacetate-coenzyme A ligase PaaK-like adenylate-forming protein